MRDESAQNPWEVFGDRVREARDGRGWTQQQLADRMTERGYPIDRTMVLRVEKGRKHVSLREVFAFAVALDVDPLHLIIPLEDDAPVAITERVTLPAVTARKWIRGELLVPFVSGDLRQLPRSELRALVWQEVTRGMRTVTLALRTPGGELDQLVDRITDELRNPKEDTDGDSR
jgi:transcriptional regulator with XRE-family HTH domain